MYQNVRDMHPIFININQVLVYPKSASSHVFSITVQKLRGYDILSRPTYSSDLSPTDYLFLKNSDHIWRVKCFSHEPTFNKRL